MTTKTYKQSLAIAGILVVFISLLSYLETATAQPLTWSQSQREVRQLKYDSREYLGVEEAKKLHIARQECVRLKQYALDFDACVGWIVGGDE